MGSPLTTTDGRYPSRLSPEAERAARARDLPVQRETVPVLSFVVKYGPPGQEGAVVEVPATAFDQHNRDELSAALVALATVAPDLPTSFGVAWRSQMLDHQTRAALNRLRVALGLQEPRVHPAVAAVRR